MDHSIIIQALDRRTCVPLMFTANQGPQDGLEDILQLLREAAWSGAVPRDRRG